MKDSVWKLRPTIEQLNATLAINMMEHLGIEFLEMGDDYLSARMPVDHRTHQPFGVLHGGASVVLAETLGSAAGNLCVDQQTEACVGLEINANHVKPVKSGWVTGKTTPVHIGRKTQVWNIEIRDESEKLVCTSRITLAVIPKI